MTSKNALGTVEIADEVLAAIAGQAATSCAGVKGMTSQSVSTELAYLIGWDSPSRGVCVTAAPDGGVDLDLHLAVEHGVNIAMVCRAVIREVRRHVEYLTGIKVQNVDVYVERMRG